MMAAALHALVDAGLCGSVSHLPTTPSTNAVAMAEAAAGDASPLPRLIIADRQTGGRGRLGRSWYSDGGTLTMTIVYPLGGLRLDEAALPAVALAAGMAVADAVEDAVPPIRALLKWPNDVYAGGGKVAGILVETSSAPPRRVIVGIGVNVATDLRRASADVAARARSLDALAGRPLDRYDLLPGIVRQMRQRLDQLADDPAALFAQYGQRCLLTGREVRIRQGERMIEGRVLGIQADGGLLLHTVAGTLAIRSGELQPL